MWGLYVLLMAQGEERHAEPTEDAKIDLGVREMARFLKADF